MYEIQFSDYKIQDCLQLHSIKCTPDGFNDLYLIKLNLLINSSSAVLEVIFFSVIWVF